MITAGKKLILTVVPSQKSQIYPAIKKLCYIDAPTPSQVVTMNVLKKASDKGQLASVALKVVVQMATKL